MKKFFFLGALLLTLAVTSCREDSDSVKSYAFNDNMAYGEAMNSFAGKFKVLWKGLNQNYGIWDYEREQGLDWDAAYADYLPRFEALDEQDEVSDDELKALLAEVGGLLHDGHLHVQMQNHTTGHFVGVTPNLIRNQERDDYNVAIGFTPILSGYYGSMSGTGYDIVYTKETSTRPNDIYAQLLYANGYGLRWVEAERQRIKAKASLSEMDAYRLQGFNEVERELIALQDLSSAEKIDMYNDVAARYAYLDIPGLLPIDRRLANAGICVKFSLFSNNVAYFYLSGFTLSPYLDSDYQDDVFAGASQHTLSQIAEVRLAWEQWFSNVQRLHREGRLGGVIIDLRSNGGGYLNDYQYVLGSLLPSGGVEIGKARYKRGIGRYDYSPLMPVIMPTYADEHETITERVAVLANMRSVSMSELTSLSTKQFDNMRLVGKRTWGGLSGLTDISDYSKNYAGTVGQAGVTPVFLYVPVQVTMTSDQQILESIGVEPDLEVNFDMDEFFATRRDTQLERALQYVTTGN